MLVFSAMTFLSVKVLLNRVEGLELKIVLVFLERKERKTNYQKVLGSINWELFILQ
jgi:hypothetical protein